MSARAKQLTISSRSPKLLLCFWFPTVSSSYLKREMEWNEKLLPSNRSVIRIGKAFMSQQQGKSFSFLFPLPRDGGDAWSKKIARSRLSRYLFVCFRRARATREKNSRHDKVISGEKLCRKAGRTRAGSRILCFALCFPAIINGEKKPAKCFSMLIRIKTAN
jgi:hypothetical protein